MIARIRRSLTVAALMVSVTLAYSQEQARIELFSPQGTVKKIRQVQVRFSAPMVSFGDPRGVEPFDIECPEKGSARWADSKNWIYDFDRDLPGGIRCEFRAKETLRTLAGNPIGGQRNFSFSTGGPAIINSVPHEGSQAIDEEQIFILELDVEAPEASIFANVFFVIEGISERVGVRILSGDEREALLKSQYRYRLKQAAALRVIQAKQKFPAGSKVSLVWGRGVSSQSGVSNSADQILPFQTRTPFSVRFHCPRENAQADCVPVTPMRLSFSGAVDWSAANSARLVGPAGRQWLPERLPYEAQDKYVHEIIFKGPFPEKSEFKLSLNPGITDDAGRKLTNAGSFPLTVKTAEYPPLAKFAANFGILELKAKPMLPVTLRNIERMVAASSLEVTEGESSIEAADDVRDDKSLAGKIQGKLLRVPTDMSTQILLWLRKIEQRTWEDREKSVFSPAAATKARSFSIPKLQSAKNFEVVGIPIPEPGFYVVEIKSEILGAALLGQPKPMYVPAAVLVTNLSVHFKWGIESSLVWVTTLDKARPAKDSLVKVSDCKDTVLWEGRTDRDGIARPSKLPAREDLRPCSYNSLDRGLMVTAELEGDMAFVNSSWDEGIEPWRFGLPTEYEQGLVAAHTVFDRSLFRAGESVNMKHFLRRHVTAGFAPFPDNEKPKSLVIQHSGSEQKYEFPLTWDSLGIAETRWTIPKEAKLGFYQVYLSMPNQRYEALKHSGGFRVEEYRVPLMKGVLRFPAAPLISPSEVTVDLAVNYLAGGGAGALPAKFRHHVQPAYIPPFAGFEDFLFANGGVKEGLVRSDSEEEGEEGKPFQLKSLDLTLDKTGSARTTITGLPKIETPMELLTELEFKDPNGEIQTVSSRLPLWPADWLVGIKPDSWALSKDSLKFQVAVADPTGKPVVEAPVRVDLFQRQTYSNRKRLVGGFYAYEHYSEIKRVSALCEGKTDKRGILICEAVSPVSGNLILQASTRDNSGRETTANRDVWVAGEKDWWFAVEDADRMDVLPEKKRYEPGEKAKFQVRMPFRSATALVTVEREGVGDAFVRDLSGKAPVIEIPIKGSFAPNTFISVLAVRGRVAGVQPTATVDLGRPAYKLGTAQINVGWKAHELKVQVSADRPVYKVREKAKVTIRVKTADGKLPPRGCEVALAAVDEGLLELMPNESWALLEAMMGKRRYGVHTSTAQMHVIGKRHFGLKALPQGGGGGKQSTRELFDTLLLWRGRVPLDANGEATVEIPLNDSLTSFRIVAVASADLDRFGTGSTSIRSTQDLIIFSGIAPLVRQGDRYKSEFTLRNTTERAMEVQVSARVKELPDNLKPATISLSPGESKVAEWDILAPLEAESLHYEVTAKTAGEAEDRLSVAQKVVPAVPVRAIQATLTQSDKDLRIPVARPADAIPGRGGIDIVLRPTLLDGMAGVTDYMTRYPYTCLEQESSRAVALRDEPLWNHLMSELPSYLDSDGLAKYFPRMDDGSEVLTSYIIAIADEAGWQIPDGLKQRMTTGLKGFIEGRVVRGSRLPTADLSIRKIAALEALARGGQADPKLLSSISIEPNLWPTSAVIDWFNILRKVATIRNRAELLKEADQILRSRLNFQGTTMGFSTERTDFLWWLMVSNDANAVRLILSQQDSPAWKDDLPRLVRGALARQRRGHWDTTVANAWGVLAMEKFSAAFEKTPVSGTSTATLLGKAQTVDWNQSPKGKTLSFAWPAQPSELSLGTATTGKPWVTVQSLAALPLKQPLSSGYKITKTISAVEQKEPGVWRRGDILRVRLRIEAQADMTWVVLSDPIPAGSAILGTGLGRDSQLATQREESRGWVWPAFEERSFESFRAYYEFAPKGEWTVEYTLRVNNEGQFNLPTTRVEAMYSPEMFGEIPNAAVRVLK